MTNTANLPFYLAKFELITYMRVLIVSGGKPTKNIRSLEILHLSKL